jgi:Domain of unknown function (DUF4399)
MISRRSLLVAAPALLAPLSAWAAGPSKRPADAYLYIIWPTDGAVIKGGFWCRFGLRNMNTTQAGSTAENAGHHHLFVDVDEPLDPDAPIPQDKKHLHFGAGQTEARVELPPGQHTVQLVLGDAKHVPFDPPLDSKKIRITVT